MAQVATPAFSPSGGEVAPESTFTITCATEGATIYYTYGNETPSPLTWTEYDGAVTLPSAPSTSIQVRAYAVKSGSDDSEVETVEFQTQVDTPVFSPAGGQVNGESTFTITCATGSANIYYTLGDTNPSTNWTAYSGAVTLPVESGKTVAVRAFAAKGNDMTDSAVASVEFYTIGYSGAVSADAPAVVDTNATQGLGAVCEGIGKSGADNSSISGWRIGASGTTTDLKIEYGDGPGV